MDGSLYPPFFSFASFFLVFYQLVSFFLHPFLRLWRMGEPWWIWIKSDGPGRNRTRWTQIDLDGPGRTQVNPDSCASHSDSLITLLFDGGLQCEFIQTFYIWRIRWGTLSWISLTNIFEHFFIRFLLSWIILFSPLVPTHPPKIRADFVSMLAS